MLPPQFSSNYLLIIFSCYLSFFLVFFVLYSLTSSVSLSVRYPINHRGLHKLSVKLNHVPYGRSCPSQQSGASSNREADLNHHRYSNTSCHHNILVPTLAQNIFFGNGEPVATYVAATLHYRIEYFMKIFLFVVHFCLYFKKKLFLNANENTYCQVHLPRLCSAARLSGCSCNTSLPSPLCDRIIFPCRSFTCFKVFINNCNHSELY